MSVITGQGVYASRGSAFGTAVRELCRIPLIVFLAFLMCALCEAQALAFPEGE